MSTTWHLSIRCWHCEKQQNRQKSLSSQNFKSSCKDDNRKINKIYTRGYIFSPLDQRMIRGDEKNNAEKAGRELVSGEILNDVIEAVLTGGGGTGAKV